MSLRGGGDQVNGGGRGALRSDDNYDDEPGAAKIAWIGVDWGTSNCAVAVYDRNRGGCKWLRLAEIGAKSLSSDKMGRLVPSILLLATSDFVHHGNNDSTAVRNAPWQPVGSDLVASTEGMSKDVLSSLSLLACFGAAAQQVIACLMDSTSIPSQQAVSPSAVDAATIRSVKRHILQQLEGVTTSSASGVATSSTNSSTITITVTPLGCSTELTMNAVSIVAIMLQLLRVAAMDALQRNSRQRRKPKWDIPVTYDNGDSGIYMAGTTSTSTTATMTSACCGVPAAAPYLYRQFVQQAAIQAGFVSATSTTVTESTAAAMAYGLLSSNNTMESSNDEVVNGNTKRGTDGGNGTTTTVLVFDMGGGTTDVTIARKENGKGDHVDNNNDIATSRESSSSGSGFRVCVTVGNDRLGGDDMDDALLQVVENKIRHEFPQLVDSSEHSDSSFDSGSSTTRYRQQLLHQCRTAKLSLCGENSKSDSSALPSSVEIAIPSAWLASTTATTATAARTRTTVPITITQDDWETALTPIVEQTRSLIELALVRYEKYIDEDSSLENMNEINSSRAVPLQHRQPLLSYPFDEVILIGGASRVPSIRRLLQDMALTRHELCTSVNADSAVAQGCAVAAAVDSGAVPLYEVQSALMLDTIPHPIGVLCPSLSSDNDTNDDDSRFVEILAQYATLPANGYAPFQLANIQQPGVTLQAVERIVSNHYVNLGDFTFLLHRLSKPQIAALPNGVRTIDIGMTLRPNGEFVVSIFDANDPDHIRKRERSRKAANNRHSSDKDNALDKMSSSVVEDPMSLEQISLIGASIVLFLLYVAAKLCFHDIDAALQ